jgi:hypothetical protein
MIWYAASVILYTELKDEPQQEYPIWENVYLFRTQTPDEALVLAEQRAKLDCEASEEGFAFNDKPARLVYGGIRKLITCEPGPSRPGPSEAETLENGVEATYSSMVVSSREDLEALIRGEPVKVLYAE